MARTLRSVAWILNPLHTTLGHGFSNPSCPPGPSSAICQCCGPSLCGIPPLEAWSSPEGLGGGPTGLFLVSFVPSILPWAPCCQIAPLSVTKPVPRHHNSSTISKVSNLRRAQRAKQIELLAPPLPGLLSLLQEPHQNMRLLYPVQKSTMQPLQG